MQDAPLYGIALPSYLFMHLVALELSGSAGAGGRLNISRSFGSISE